MRAFLRHVTSWVLPLATVGALVIYMLNRHDGNTDALSHAATYWIGFVLFGTLFSLQKLRE